MMIPTPVHQADAVCAAANCTRPPAGGQLCSPDADRLGQWLAQLGAEYELLCAAPSMQGREVGSIHGNRLTSQRSPGNTHVMAMRDRRPVTAPFTDPDPWGVDDTPSVYVTLATYAGLVREGRGLVEPRLDLAYVRSARPAGPVCDPERPRCGHHTCEVWTFRANVAAPLTVATERKLLAAHLDWILGQDWCGEFHDEIRGLWAMLRRANGHAATRPGYTAHCDCGGRIRWVNGAAVCQACGASIATSDAIRRHAVKASA